ncbi:carboxymuconolactone decarboxylase family protein [Rathayibacter soli]|uniref:carboxymuconolactone decarboxylase family protein n=1 Tax=Rathayibacter soli TaxID=3144168 RepID=UPI0027E469F1|nr:carboxymuconolactone decarboxylase family protein [Glaciibacter superstes]
MISTASGMRLPDAARVAFYHKEFVGSALGAWTQAVMRGPSDWSVGERELMAAMVARWNSCEFCIGAHRAIAIRGMTQEVVDACLADPLTAPIPERLRATLTFLEKMTKYPRELNTADAEDALRAGTSRAQLMDAAAVAALFNITTRYADSLKFAIPTAAEFDKSAEMMLKRGYA